MSDVSSLKDTIVAKSNQLNADDLLSGPRTVVVTAVKRSSSPDQPIDICFEGDDGKPYKPCKSMRKVLIFAWGDDGRDWAGRSMTLFNDPSVLWGGVKVGGIRISHLSDIERDIAISLTATKGKKAPVTVRKLAVERKAAPAQKQEPTGPSAEDVENAAAALNDAAAKGTEVLVAAWKATAPELRAMLSGDGKCPAEYKAVAAKADEAATDEF